LSVRNVNNIVNIKNCIFERGTSYTYGGGAINAEYSDMYVSDCKFNDNFSFKNGGIFNIINANTFTANNIKA